jgi:hypothetical protein
MDIQFEVQKIHSQFGTTEMANYQIQKLFDKLILEDRAEQLRKHAVSGQVCSFYMSGMDTSGKCNNCGKKQWEH